MYKGVLRFWRFIRGKCEKCGGALWAFDWKKSYCIKCDLKR